MLLLLGIIAVALFLLHLLNPAVAWKQNSDLIKGAGGALFVIGKWALGFFLIFLATYALVITINHREVFEIVASLVVAAVVLSVAVPYLLNFKTIQRERFFESQITAAKSRRIEMGIPHYVRRNYQDYLASSDWRTLTKHANQAMNGKCEFCEGRATSIHHVYYPKNRSDLGLENIATLCVVCKECHDVLHGLDNGGGGKCALCRKVKGTKKLPIKVARLSKRQQLVCKRCNTIAMGFRDEAYQWTRKKYLEWIAEWQELVLADLARQRQKRP
jgi:hypothetical protein